MKIIFFGSPEFAVPSLETIHQSNHQIAAVVTQPDRPSGRKLKLHAPAVKIAAEKFGLQIIQPETTKDPNFVQQLADFHVDILVVVAYGEILRRNLLELAPHGAVNLHGSLLPKYRGAAPIAWAILNGEIETGATTMKMNEKMDAGPVLLQGKYPITPEHTTATLSSEIATIGAQLLTQTLDLLEANTIQPKEQNVSQVSFAPKLKKENGLIDWRKTADYISRQIRAFDPWPGSFSTIQGKQVKIWRAYPEEKSTKEGPGTVLEIGKKDMLIAAGEGSSLQVLEVQPENRARISAIDFANGQHLSAGSRFDVPLI